MSDQFPIRKTEARLAERQRARAEEQRKATIKKLVPLAVVFLVAVFVIFVGFTALTQTSGQNVQGATGPRLQVDREKIELGKQIFDKPVRAAFTVKNVGDSTLKLEAPKIASILEGCWPPEVVVGQTTLQPGQQTTLSMEFMMHEGMGGKHLFEVALKTNDPTQALKKLLVASDWQPN